MGPRLIVTKSMHLRTFVMLHNFDDSLSFDNNQALTIYTKCSQGDNGFVRTDFDHFNCCSDLVTKINESRKTERLTQIYASFSRYFDF